MCIMFDQRKCNLQNWMEKIFLFLHKLSLGGSVEPVMRDHYRERPPVLGDHILKTTWFN